MGFPGGLRMGVQGRPGAKRGVSLGQEAPEPRPSGLSSSEQRCLGEVAKAQLYYRL